MKIDIKKLSDELGLNYEVDETKTIRCTYCGYYILRYDPNIKATKTFDDIFYKTRIGGKNEKGTFSFFEVDRVYNDDYNYNFLKNALINTINKFKLEKIEKRKEDLCKDF